jgi:hypothetical protein
MRMRIRRPAHTPTRPPPSAIALSLLQRLMTRWMRPFGGCVLGSCSSPLTTADRRLAIGKRRQRLPIPASSIAALARRAIELKCSRNPAHTEACHAAPSAATRLLGAHGHYWIMKHDQFLVLDTNPMPPHVSVRASAYFQLRPFPFSSPSPCPFPCPFPSRLEPWPWSPSWSPRPLPTTPALVRPNRSRRQTLLRPASCDHNRDRDHCACRRVTLAACRHPRVSEAQSTPRCAALRCTQPTSTPQWHGPPIPIPPWPAHHARAHSRPPTRSP